MAKASGFAKAFAGRWCVAEMDKRSSQGKDTTTITPPAARIRFVCARG